ncbi:TPA: transcriptional regulator [Acinetobacter baumannii]|nr:transcriptional regulator [Acinetobacter baumannii]
MIKGIFIPKLQITDKFYEWVNSGKIKQPIRVSEKDVFWYSSYVKQKVEEYKQESDIVAHI